MHYILYVRVVSICNIGRVFCHLDDSFLVQCIESIRIIIGTTLVFFACIIIREQHACVYK